MPLLYPKLTQRPLNFRINRKSPLYRSLVFAGLGQSYGTNLYRDASDYGNHGTLTGYTGAGDTPAERWTYDGYLRRFVLGFDATNDIVTGPTQVLAASSSWTICGWVSDGGVQDDSIFFGFGGLQPTDTTGGIQRYLVASSGQYSFWGSNADFNTTVAVKTDSVFHHLAVTCANGTALSLWLDGIVAQPGAPSDVFSASGAYFAVGGGLSWGAPRAKSVSDFCIFGADISSYLPVLADPTNTALRIGNVPLILPPRRRLFAAVTETATPPVYSGSLAATTAKATAALSGGFTVPVYAGVAGASAPKATAAFSGSFTAPVYSGALAASSTRAAISLAGTCTAPVYSGSLIGEAPRAAAAMSGAFTPPVYAAALAAQTPHATADLSGSSTAPTYSGMLASEATKASASLAGAFTSPVYAGALAAESSKATASLSGSFTAPVYAGVLAGQTAQATASLDGTFTAPVYSAALVAEAPRATCDLTGGFAVPTYRASVAAHVKLKLARISETATLAEDWIPGESTAIYVNVPEMEDRILAVAGTSITEPMYGGDLVWMYQYIGSESYVFEVVAFGGRPLGWGIFTAPVYSAALVAEAPRATCDLTGGFVAPTGAGSLNATVTRPVASLSGGFVAPTYAGDLQATGRRAVSPLTGGFISPVQAGSLAATARKATATLSGGFATPFYAGGLAATVTRPRSALSGSKTAPLYAGSLAGTTRRAQAALSGTAPVSVNPVVVENYYELLMEN